MNRFVNTTGHFEVPNEKGFNIALGYSDTLLPNTSVAESFGGNRVIKEKISIDY